MLETILLRSNYIVLSLKTLCNYFVVLVVKHHDINSLWGFFALLTIFCQLVTGTLLSFSYLPDPMLVPIVRDEEDSEDIVIEDSFQGHERGVDLIFIFAYIHLFRKFYLNLLEYEHEVTWKSGVYTLLIMQGVVFCGLALCCSHLSEITLTIAANIMHTFFLFYGKPYWWIFTNKQLNTDTTIRLAYAHYLSAFFMFYAAVIHCLDMHFDWKNESSEDGLNEELSWFDEALSNELAVYASILFVIFHICSILYEYPEALSYEIFMWGDVGIVSDIRFYGVSPHWYFRPLMAWLLVCPFHRLGLMGLLLYFASLYFQPDLHNDSENLNFTKTNKVVYKFLTGRSFFFVAEEKNTPDLNIVYQCTFFLFFASGLYTFSFLPYGRFYNRLGGNPGALGAYAFLFSYLVFTFIRRPVTLELHNSFFSEIAFFLKTRRG